MAQVITGKVLRTNGNGFKLESQDKWLNISKYAQDVQMPEVGQQVKVSLDSAGFVRKVEKMPGQQPGPANGSRDTTITRLAVLNTATAILSSGNQVVDADEVLALATRLEAWATR